MKQEVEIECLFCNDFFKVAKAKFLRLQGKGDAPKFCSRECFLDSRGMAAKRSAWRLNVSMNELEKKLSADVLRSHPVTTLAEMSPEKQDEMRVLYQRDK